ncbi:SH3 domain-containing protein [Candidatus Dojkabacteria bacterium]|nr:SH3 domain-containing protein [Candidatus Dojkabacteria bacterium]
MKNLLIFLITSAFLFTTLSVVSARYENIEDTKFGIDPALSSEVNEFGLPDSIVVGIIESPSVDFNISFENWYSGMYYYQVTRYGLPSISFHYVISPNGDLVLNKNSQVEREITLEGMTSSNPIVIGLFVNDVVGLTPRLGAKVSEILLDIANNNSIPIEKIYVKDIGFVENEKRNLIMKAKDPYGTWINDFEKIKEAIKGKYLPTEKEYKLELAGDPQFPTGPLEVNEEFEVKLKIRNTGNNPIYAGSSGEFLLSLLDKEDKSRFYINDVWLSQTQARLMADGEILKIGEEKEFVFIGKTPLDIGKISENFELVNISGKKYSDKQIKIEVELEKTSRKIVEVLETETGYLRVREKADFSSNEVERISPGDRFFVLDSTSGFYNIDLGNDQKGWVYSKYVKSIQ